jgi:hypothetical protein
VNTPRLLLVALSASAAIALPIGAPVIAAPSPAPALRHAEDLAATWGRCATARPAHRALALAQKPAAMKVRVVRAHRALDAWQQVVVECSAPIDLPVAQPGA